MKVRRISMTVKLIVVLITLLVASDAVLGIVLYNKSYSDLESQIRTGAENTARCAAASVDGELIGQVADGDQESEAYQKIHAPLTTFLENGGVEYVYTIKKGGSGFVYVVDSDPEEPGVAAMRSTIPVRRWKRRMPGRRLPVIHTPMSGASTSVPTRRSRQHPVRLLLQLSISVWTLSARSQSRYWVRFS